MLFSLSVAVPSSPIVCDNLRGDSFTPNMVILFKLESLAGEGTRATDELLMVLLFGSLLADFDRELITWLRAKSYSHLRKSGFLYGDNGFVPRRFLNDSLDVTEHFTVELLLQLLALAFDVFRLLFMGRVLDDDVLFFAVEIGRLAFNALEVDEIGSFFTGNLCTESADGFLLFKLVIAADTAIDSLNALLLLLIALLVFLRLWFWLLLMLLLLLLVVLLVAFEYEHREWDKLVGSTPPKWLVAHGFTLMDADVDMGDDDRLLK